MVAANRKYYPRWFSVCQSCFLDVWCPPSQFPPSNASRTALPVSCRLMVENARIGLAGPGTIRICRTTPSRTPGTARNGQLIDPTFTEDVTYHPSNTTRIDITRRNCATWESYRYEMAHKYHLSCIDRTLSLYHGHTWPGSQ